MKILVLFDIDGTMLKLRDGQSRIIFSEVMKEIFNADIPPDKLPNFSGMTDLQILWELSLLTGVSYRIILNKIELIWEKLAKMFREFCTKEHLEIFPGVQELIQSLAKNENIQLGLLTGNFQTNAYLKLKAFELDKYFHFGAFGNDHRDRNNLAEIAIRRANNYSGKQIFGKRNTLIIGDSPRDIECAKTNGLKVMCVTTGHHSHEELAELKADAIFENFKDFKEVMVKIINLFL